MSVFSDTPAPPAPKGKRKCSVCGEIGHTSRRHGGSSKAATGKQSGNATRARNLDSFLTIPVSALAVAGNMSGSKPLVADAIVLSHASRPLAQAVADLADQDDRIARVVDSLVQTGPYAAVFSAILPVALQIAANHSDRIAQSVRVLGLATVDEIINAEYGTENTTENAQREEAV